MSPAAAFHAQLASIMEVLANTAVAEICELVDNGYSVLQLEISRSRKENEVLRRKLRLMELRAARATALRAAVTASGAAVLHASGRARAELRRSANPAGEVVLSRLSNQETARCGDHSPPAESRQESVQRTQPADETAAAAVIKVEDDDDVSWSQSEPDKGFCQVEEGQMEAEAPIKQEAGNDGGVSWMSGEVSSTSAQNCQRSETSSYDCLILEPQHQHGSCTSQNSLGAEAGCSSASDSGGSFPFPLSEASLSAAEQPAGFQSSQQRAALANELPVRKETAGEQRSFVRRGGWRHQDAVSRAASRRGEDGGGKSFVCNCCGKTLACLKNLKTHMRVHTGEKPFVCALCGKRFSDSSNLKRHQSVHTGEKRYGCVHCGKRFAQSGSLKVHMTVHTDCKQFRCSYCNKTFISGSHLRRHVTVHAGEKRFGAAVQ